MSQYFLFLFSKSDPKLSLFSSMKNQYYLATWKLFLSNTWYIFFVFNATI